MKRITEISQLTKGDIIVTIVDHKVVKREFVCVHPRNDKYSIFLNETYDGCPKFYNETLKSRKVWEVDPESIGQYTGLKDKNGNKIFEGDIVIIAEKLKAKVIYYDGAFRMQSEFSPTPINTTDMGYMMREFSVRVIGNVHDDPELIK